MLKVTKFFLNDVFDAAALRDDFGKEKSPTRGKCKAPRGTGGPCIEGTARVIHKIQNQIIARPPEIPDQREILPPAALRIIGQMLFEIGIIIGDETAHGMREKGDLRIRPGTLDFTKAGSCQENV